jgi:Gelsolin repeat
MPPPLPLTSERLERHGLFLIEDSQTLFLWVGRDAVPQLIIDVFDLPNYETLRGGKVFSPSHQSWRVVQLTALNFRPHCHSLTILSRSV